MRTIPAGLVAIAILAGATRAHAGDACPIQFDVYDVTPPWLDRDEQLGALASQHVYVGVGYRTTDAGVEAVTIADGSPAERGGLKPGDLITAIDGTSVVGAKRPFEGKLPAAVMKLTVTRAGKSIELALKPGYMEPLAAAFLQHVNKRDDCTVVKLGHDVFDRDLAVKALFTDGKRLRCEDAHRRLGAADFEAGDVVIARGRRRVLLALPDWKTVCVKAKDTDGDGLARKRVRKLFGRLTDAYVQDRIDNP